MTKLFRLLIVFAAVCLVSLPAHSSAQAEEKANGFCAVISGGQNYIIKDCIVTAEKSDTMEFVYIKRPAEKPLFEEITMISITKMSPDTAEVSGLTTDGINSRWGEAKFDGKCWVGSDFLIYYSN